MIDGHGRRRAHYSNNYHIAVYAMVTWDGYVRAMHAYLVHAHAKTVDHDHHHVPEPAEIKHLHVDD